MSTDVPSGGELSRSSSRGYYPMEGVSDDSSIQSESSITPPAPSTAHDSQNAYTNEIAKKKIAEANSGTHVDRDWLKIVVSDPNNYSKIVKAMHQALEAEITVERQQKKVKQAMDNMWMKFQEAIAKGKEADPIGMGMDDDL